MLDATPRLLACWLALAALVTSSTALAAESETAPAGAGPAQDVCPAIDEDFALCSSDSWSGNCAQFVAAAGRLAQLYQIQVAEDPQRASMLLSTNWWGCGEASLTQIRELLLRIGTPEARAVLQQEPFSRLARQGSEQGPRPSAPPPEVDCENEPTPDAQDACAARELASAEHAYRRVFEACTARVAEPLRSSFQEDEQAWQQELPTQCDAAAFEYGEPRLQAFARSQCRASALRERTRGMLAAHPECRSTP